MSVYQGGGPARDVELKAALLWLNRLGVDPTDLASEAARTARVVPTVSEWIGVVSGLVSTSTARCYRP